LTARALESAGIVTVVIGNAFDILEACAIPRFIFSDLPLGNPLGNPFDRDMQRKTLELALRLAVTAKSPEFIETGVRFSSDDAWKTNYGQVTDSNRTEFLQLGDENRAQRRADREKGLFRH
jgi:D-proline reductase (dithiol) PrdB|tara:strand:- start:359 stop:721 length:363 start_codon:yes stop_codon:yes gene_type:complete